GTRREEGVRGVVEPGRHGLRGGAAGARPGRDGVQPALRRRGGAGAGSGVVPGSGFVGRRAPAPAGRRPLQDVRGPPGRRRGDGEDRGAGGRGERSLRQPQGHGGRQAGRGERGEGHPARLPRRGGASRGLGGVQDRRPRGRGDRQGARTPEEPARQGGRLPGPLPPLPRPAGDADRGARGADVRPAGRHRRPLQGTEEAPAPGPQGEVRRRDRNALATLRRLLSGAPRRREPRRRPLLCGPRPRSPDARDIRRSRARRTGRGGEERPVRAARQEPARLLPLRGPGLPLRRAGAGQPAGRQARRVLDEHHAPRVRPRRLRPAHK
ncbi:MAG: hypothetical protein AVDCRST_MAG22-2455, partial [uncultured Rubrobacteraceae bacterium]